MGWKTCAGVSSCLLMIWGGAVVAAQPRQVTDRAVELVRDLDAGRFRAAAHSFNATMRRALPVEKLRAVWGQVTAQVGSLKAIGEPRVAPSGPYRLVVLPCRFEKAPLDVKVSFDADDRVAGLFFAPHAEPAGAAPRPPGGVVERDVTVGDPPWELPGTLTLPSGDGPFPAVVLVAGSGPHDRDETIGPNAVFRDLAWGLAQQGVASLRYEKRTKQYPMQCARNRRFTVKDEVVEDAHRAVALLEHRPEIDHSRIFVLGHSLGGAMAPRIAEEDPKVAGIIVMAGPTRPLEELLAAQIRYLAGRDGKVSPEEQQEIQKAEAAVRRIRDPKLTPEDTVDVLGVRFPGSYWLDLRGYRPAQVAARLRRPVLILQGGRDYMVTQEDLEGWKKTLGGRTSVSFRVYPELNHLFIRGKGKPSPEELVRPGHVDPRVIRDIAQWVLEKAGEYPGMRGSQG